MLSDEDLDIAKFLEAVNMRIVAEKPAAAWADINTDTIHKLWRKLFPLPTLQSSLATVEESPATAQSDAFEIAGFLTSFQQWVKT